MKRLYFYGFVILFALVAGFVVAIPNPMQAETQSQADISNDVLASGCNATSSGYYIGELEVPRQQYDVYVRLGKRGQQAPATAYVRTSADSEMCQRIGSVDASGDEWRLLGSWSPLSQSGKTIFQLSSSALYSSPDANRPALMLVDAKNPLCRPTTECEVSLDGIKGYVRPGGTLLDEDSLHVVRTINPDQDMVKRVDYYVDNQIKYSEASLQPFDLRYASHDSQALLRVVTYESGQRVFLPSTVPDDFNDSFVSFLFRFVHFNPKVVTALQIAISLAIGMAALLLWLKLAHRRHRYRVDHGLVMERPATTLTSANRTSVNQRVHSMLFIQHILAISGILLSVIAFVAVVNGYFLQAATVSGSSMETTYHDGDKVFVNKTTKTWNVLRSREYVPKRGDVVVVQPVFGTADLTVGEPSGSYIVKRVIALPGERVVVKDGRITVYNQAHPEGFNPDTNVPWQKNVQASTNTQEHVDVTLDASELFVSGDNRPASVDSRYNGPVRTQNVVGTVTFGF
ncbi:MAG: signal peptidase I [Candidatus Saccharimonadales bacterium]